MENVSDEYKKVLVLTDAMPWGHRSIAKAIFEYLKAREDAGSCYRTEYAEVKTGTDFFNDLYIFAYRYAPRSTKVFHRYSGGQLANSLLHEIAKMNISHLADMIDRMKPDLVISTYFVHSHSLVRLRRQKNLGYKIWTVVHDPWTVTPLTLIRDADLNIVYDERSFEEGLKWGVPGDRMLITGWWTREAMYGEYDRDRVRRELGFEDDRPVVFVGGGSLGTNSLLKLLPTIMAVKTKAGFIINTGTDKVAKNLVEMTLRTLARLNKDAAAIVRSFGWIDNMAEMLSACDIVFGKAGPNFLFDVVAARKHFVAITHMGGQEDGNIDLIEKKQIGWVKENTEDLTQFLLDYLSDPKRFENMYTENIERERETNRGSLGKLHDRMLDEWKH